ncbi:MAG TPA: IPT/TIG domain-containing protein [Terriglobales bacterium]|nr:IPT/TIG domain-containing protein [Terriglobales bacterium]
MNASVFADNPPSVGQAFVGRTGIIGMTIYLIFLSFLMMYLLVKIWPRTAPAAWSSPKQTQNITTEKPTGTANAISAPDVNADQPVQIVLFCGLWKPWLWSETRLLLIVILAGAFGSSVHAMRSFYWYVGNRALRWSWAIMYVLLPVGGGILAMLFYFVVRGGFFSSQSTVEQTSPFAFAAFSGLVGMFSTQAVEKLKQVAATVFTQAPQGRNYVGPAPMAISVSPNAGPSAGGTAIQLTGTSFAAGMKVVIGGALAVTTSVSSSLINATTPPHSAGPVDVEVISPDGQTTSLSAGFTYT